MMRIDLASCRGSRHASADRGKVSRRNATCRRILTRLQRLTRHRLVSSCRRGSRNTFVPLWLYCIHVLCTRTFTTQSLDQDQFKHSLIRIQSVRLTSLEVLTEWQLCWTVCILIRLLFWSQNGRNCPKVQFPVMWLIFSHDWYKLV